MNKQERIQIFEDTYQKCMNHSKLKFSINETKKQTKLYKENEQIKIEFLKLKGKVSVINEGSFTSCKNYDNLVVLNFASATNPGGGVKNGSSAQEESLCRCSTLYLCLNTKQLKKEFYDNHKFLFKNETYRIYNDDIIYTPNIKIFKNDKNPKILLNENDWITTNVITCAAPRNIPKINDKELFEIFKKRIRKIFEVAIINHNTNIVLGAWGCGAFQNPPYLVAKAFKEVLNEGYRECFDNIIFSILKSSNEENYKVFERMFSSY